MTEREGKEDDRGGTAEVRSFLLLFLVLFVLLLRGQVFCSPTRTHNSLSLSFVCPRCCFLCVIKFERLTRLNTSPDIPPKLQNRKNARDRLVRESESRRARSDRAQSGH